MKSYHYTECGLDNVYLINGYQIHKTSQGEGVSIENAEDLHKTIGLWLAKFPKPLSGKEFRFLRHEMDLSQKALARLFGVEEQTVSLWEREKTSVPSISDRLIRILYCDYKDGCGSAKELVETLAELDQIEGADCYLEKSNGWHTKRVA